MKRKIAIFTFAGASVALAGWPVFDWTASLNAAKQIKELVEIYQKIEKQYDHLVAQSKYIYRRSKYAARSAPWKLLDVHNRSAVTDLWESTANEGGKAREAWERATSRQDKDSMIILDELSGETKAQIDIGHIELQDGTAVAALDTIGDIRANGIESDRTLGLLENDALSDDPELNTEAAQLNTSNAIALVQVKEARSANQIALAQTEIALLRMKAEREAAARALASEAEYRTKGIRAMEETTSGGSEAIKGWRLP